MLRLPSPSPSTAIDARTQPESHRLSEVPK
jgi:hypothetical protein